MSVATRPSPRTLTTDLAALAAGVTEATIRKWASRGKLTRYGRPGRAEYSIQELACLLTTKHGTALAALACAE